MSSFIRGAAALLLAGVCSPTWSTECDKDPNCFPGSYDVVFPNTVCPEGVQLRCIAPPDPPAPVSMTCTSTDLAVSCQAWPRGDELLYEWSYSVTTSGMQVPGETQLEPSYSFACGGSSTYDVYVTVYSPYGVVANATGTVGCLADSGLPPPGGGEDGNDPIVPPSDEFD